MEEKADESLLAKTADKTEWKALIKRYFIQLTVGCGREHCRHECASNSAFMAMDKEAALAHAISMAKLDKRLCAPTGVYQGTEQLIRSVMQDSGDDSELGVSLDKLSGIWTSIYASRSMEELEEYLQTNGISVVDPELDYQLIRLVSVWQCPFFDDIGYLDEARQFCAIVSRLGDASLRILSKLYADSSLEHIERNYILLNTYISISWSLNEDSSVDAYAAVEPFLAFQKLIFRANLSKRRQGVPCVEVPEFYNQVINEAYVWRDDFIRLMNKRTSFVNFPFVLEPAHKATVLKVDNKSHQHQIMERAAMANFFAHSNELPFLSLTINRNNLIQDAITQLQMASNSQLRKPLKVTFANEPGMDEGGLRKEFFLLLLRELFDPDYGMFSLDADSQYYWFNPHSFEGDVQYELIGMVVGIAIYNDCILDLNLAPAVYKKLMSIPTGFDDLKHYSPSLAQGFETLLAFTGDVQATYLRTFTVEYEVFGEAHIDELKPGGADIPLTSDNRQEYVDLYLDYIFNSSVSTQFRMFMQGFHTVCDSPLMQMFQPEELELLVCGSRQLDFTALEDSARYEGYDKDSPMVVALWAALAGFTDTQRANFLIFVTGTDRVPIKGLGGLVLVISRNGPDSEALPTAHTCFNHLLLPEYSSPEKLCDKLTTAISNAHGFGLI